MEGKRQKELKDQIERKWKIEGVEAETQGKKSKRVNHRKSENEARQREMKRDVREPDEREGKQRRE